MHISMYHYVRKLKGSKFPNIKGLELNDFITQLNYFEENFVFVSVDDILESLNGGQKLSEQSILLTFDDGYIDHYENVYQVLKKRNIPAFFSMPGKVIREKKVLDVNKIHFILASTSVDKIIQLIYNNLDYYRGREYNIESNEFLFKKLAKPSRFDTAEVTFIKRLLQVELEEDLRGLIVDNLFSKCVGISEKEFSKKLYLNLDQVLEMKNNGMSWGIHGYDHYWMNRLSDKELSNDIDSALDVFDGIIDTTSWTCCYPYGSYDDNVIDTIKSKGAVLGLSTDVGKAKIDEESRYKLKRFDTNDFPPRSMKYSDLK